MAFGHGKGLETSAAALGAVDPDRVDVLTGNTPALVIRAIAGLAPVVDGPGSGPGAARHEVGPGAGPHVLSRAELGASSGLHPDHIGRLERGTWKGGTRIDNIRKLAEALGVDPAELVGD